MPSDNTSSGLDALLERLRVPWERLDLGALQLRAARDEAHN